MVRSPRTVAWMFPFVGSARSSRPRSALFALAALPIDQLARSAAAAAPPPVAIGVYRGPGPWGVAQLDSYEAFLGRRVDYALDFQDVDTWANQKWPSWMSNAWQPLPYRMVLGGTGIFPVGGTWRAGAQGTYDTHWLELGQRLVATGQEDAILRGAHEFNGNWFHYGVDQSEVADFVAAWRRWVTTTWGQLSFDLRPYIGHRVTLRLVSHDDNAPSTPSRTRFDDVTVR